MINLMQIAEDVESRAVVRLAEELAAGAPIKWTVTISRRDAAGRIAELTMRQCPDIQEVQS